MKKKVATFIVAIIFVLEAFVSSVYAGTDRTQNFMHYKLDKVRYDVPYEVIHNDDGTTTYVVYNYDGDIYEDDVINTPYEIIKLKEATSSIMRENLYLYDDAAAKDISKNDGIVDLDSPDMKIYIKSHIKSDIASYSQINNDIDKNITYDKDNSDISIYKIGELKADRYYPLILRKKSVLKIPKEIIKSMKKLDILIVFNVARNDMLPTDMWKFRYIEDVYINKNGDHKIDTKDYRRTTSLELKYLYRYEDVKLMKYEYHQANDTSGYAYIDIDHILDREELIDHMIDYDKDDIDKYIDSLDYKFISDEWQVSYDNGDIDFYLRKWVTYKINVYKEIWEKARLDVGDIVHHLRFDDSGYAVDIR